MRRLLALAVSLWVFPVSAEEVPAEDPERKTSLHPKPAEPPPGAIHFIVEPVSDFAVLSMSLAFVGLSQTIISSGELKPQQPVPTSNISALDRKAITQTIDPNAGKYSNYGLYLAGAWAVADPIISGARENNIQAFLVDAMLYAESAAITGALTNLAKIAVRRPRPRAYAEQQRLNDLYGDKAPDITETDSALSFVSGHASTTATIAATATYLAFARADRGSPRPWITLGVGTAVTAFTSYERVRSGAHFPTDVIAGALIGGAVGVLVPHIHREQTLKQRSVWIAADVPRGGGGVMWVGGLW